MIIDVEQYCIDNGHHSSFYNCPIAIAIKKELYKNGYRYVDVMVGKEEIRINQVSYVCQFSVKTFISNFDNMKEVKSFAFKLIRTGSEENS